MFSVNDIVDARLRACVAISTAIIACLAMAGCGSGSENEKSSGGSTNATQIGEAKKLAEAAQKAPSTITQTTPLTAAPAAAKSVVFVRNAEPATTEIVNAAELAAQSIGWKFDVVNYDSANPATLQAALMSALAKKPNYVMETGTPQSQFSDSVIKAYQKAGIKIIVGAAEPYQETDTVIGNPLSGDAYYQNGKDLADWFITDSHGSGHAILESVSVYPVYLKFRQGFVDEVTRLCPGCTYDIVTITPAQASGNGIIPALVSKIRSTPGVGYAFFDNGQYAVGASSAFKSAGLGNVKIGGEALTQQGIEEIKAATNSAWSAVSFYYLGYAMIDTAVRVDANASGRDQNSIQPRQLITSSNVDSVSGEWNLPADSLAQFQTLWHVPTTACRLACG